MLTLKWQILNRSGAHEQVACAPVGTLRCYWNYSMSSENIRRQRQTCATCSALWVVKSIAAGTINLSCGMYLYCLCLPLCSWLEPHSEPSARRSGGAVFTLALEIHHCPPCDPGSKRQTARQSLCWINCGIFKDCVRRSLKLFSLVGKQTPLMIFAQWLKASSVFPSTKKNQKKNRYDLLSAWLSSLRLLFITVGR